MSKIAPPDRRSPGFQSHPERIRVKRRRVPPSASSFTEVMRKSRREVRGKLTSEALFCFPALRFDVFSPNRDSRYCGAPKPGEEKQKSYDYCSAILMVHRFRSFLSVFTPVMRKIWREVTRKVHFARLNR